MIPPTIYTIGHSNHAAEKLVELLKRYEIKLVVDVRSAPYSRFNPQFNKKKLASLLAENGIDYDFRGDSLGGRPKDASVFNEQEIDYTKIRERDWFKDGLTLLCKLGGRTVLALLCAEEDPGRCHRHSLITQALLEKDVKVMHIRGTGALEDSAKDQEQLRLL